MTEIEIVVGYSRGTKSIEWIYIIKEMVRLVYMTHGV